MSTSAVIWEWETDEVRVDLEKLVEVVPDNLPAREALAWAVRRKGMNATTRN